MSFLIRLQRAYKDLESKIYINLLVILVIALVIINMYLLNIGNKYLVEVIIICVFLVLHLTIFLVFSIYAKDKNQEIKRLEKLKDAIEKKENKFRIVLENFNDVCWEYNVSTKELTLSEKWSKLTGYVDYKKYDVNFFMDKLIHPEDKSIFLNAGKDYLDGKTPFFECSFRLKDSKKVFHWVYIKGVYQDENDKADVIVGLLNDITSRKLIEEKLNNMAYYDTLTGLPNKGVFLNYLEEAVNNAVLNGTKGALIFLDIDDFKQVNDTLGHDYGDQLLKIISELMKVTFEDDKIISRIGGDEFLILTENYKDTNELLAMCNNIINLFKNPFEIGDKSIYSTVSIGVTMFPEDSMDLNALFKNADTAMYKSKEDGKNRYCFFDANMGAELERKMMIGNLLREAIVKNEFYIVYQPLYSSQYGEIVSMEALLRWNSKELGVISPSEFIPIAERNGSIISIGRWVFEEVCKQSKEWRSKGFTYKSIAVNISILQIQDEKFVSYVRDAIEVYRIEPSSIEIEITETLLMNNIYLNERKLHEIKKLGIKIAIDDFGTGYSSLNYLTYLPLDSLKIDKGFIDNITTINNDRILAQNIIKLAHDLNIKVVAEGVETKAQLDILTSINCDVIQGYYFSKPLLKKDMEVKLEELKNGGGTDGR